MYCGRIHDSEFICQQKQDSIKRRQSKDKDNEINKFHWSGDWRKKRDVIKSRDKYLCRICLSKGLINCERLSVHHIYPLVDEFGWEHRLDDDKLITTCDICHEECENGNISKNELIEIVTSKIKIK